MNKRGSTVVEAAMVFPVMILAVMSVIGILIYFYAQIGQQIGIHMALRAESGRICENIYYKEHPDTDLAVYKKSGKLYCYGTAVSEQRWLLPAGEKKLYGEKYLLDETLIIRMADMAGRGIPDDEQ